MKEQQIKRAKRLAEILGVTVYDNCDGPSQDDCFLDFYDPRSDMGPKVFNPEQDKALLWDLQLEYGIDTSVKGVVGTPVFLVYRSTSSVQDIPAALIDCVIEINGGYDD